MQRYAVTYCIHAEPVYAALQPEFHGGFVDGLARFGVFPIQVRLLRAEEVQVVFLCMFVPFPDAAGEVADPVVWWLADAVLVAWSFPMIPIPFGVVFGRAGLEEPFVLGVLVT